MIPIRVAASSSVRLPRPPMMSASAGLRGAPFTEEQVDAILGKGEWHPLMGFGVVQGVRADGSIKVRRCDDAAASGSNDCPTTYVL